MFKKLKIAAVIVGVVVVGGIVYKIIKDRMAKGAGDEKPAEDAEVPEATAKDNWN
jgi:hypothetical protein